jgi:hypothetical protein
VPFNVNVPVLVLCPPLEQAPDQMTASGSLLTDALAASSASRRFRALYPVK